MTEHTDEAVRSGVGAPNPLRAPDDDRHRSGTFDLMFDEVFRNIEQRGRGTAAPFLAVLGPTGSGKSLLLSRLAAYLDRRSPPDTYCHIKVDLRRSALTGLNQMYFDLIKAVLARAQDLGSSVQLPISRDNVRYSFVSYMREILRSIDKSVMIYINYSDYMPRFFARSLAAQFRDIREKEDLYAELTRVGIVWSGAMSLFGLMEVDSEFSMCETLVTPFSDHEHRKLLTCDQLEQSGFDVPSEEIVDYLAAQTGGEPAFLAPIIRTLRDNKKGHLAKAPLVKLMNKLSDPKQTVIPELSEVALNVYLDSDLREIVDRLLSGSMALCREPAVDVDSYHLKGAVILDRGTSRAGYSFRNELVAQFLRNLVGQSPLSRVRLGNRPADDDRVPVFPGPLNKIRGLRGLEERLAQCYDLREATTLIVEAWSTLTDCGKPTIAFCILGSDVIWFGPASGELTVTAPFATAGTAAAGAFSQGHTYFAFEDDRVSVGIPLQEGVNSAVLTGTVERNLLKLGLSETSLQHWTHFVTRFGAHLITLCMSALGRQNLLQIQRVASLLANAHRDRAGTLAYVLCFAYDCRGNPITDAVITCELVDGKTRRPLGGVRTTGDRARPARIVFPQAVEDNSYVEILGLFAGQKSNPIRLDLASSWSCEFIFHINDGEGAWKSRKRRTDWRCRHPNTQPETRSMPAFSASVLVSKAGE